MLAPGERAAVGTGIAVEIPAGEAGLVLPRSGLAARHGLALVNAPGLIDAGYRGEIRVLLLNTDRSEPVEIAAGDRIAQLVLVRGADARGGRGRRARGLRSRRRRVRLERQLSFAGAAGPPSRAQRDESVRLEESSSGT